MEFFLLTMAAVLALLIVLLAIPVVVAFEIEGLEQIHGHVHLRWLFGLVRFRIAVPSSSPKREVKGPSRRTGKRHQGKGKANLFAAIKYSPFRRRLFRFVKRLLHAFHPHEFIVRIRIGLGDPADTGRLWALLGPLSAMAANFHHAKVHLEPEFSDAVFDFTGRGKFRLIPLEFIAVTAAFALSPPTRQAWRMLRSNA